MAERIVAQIESFRNRHDSQPVPANDPGLAALVEFITAPATDNMLHTDNPQQRLLAWVHYPDDSAVALSVEEDAMEVVAGPSEDIKEFVMDQAEDRALSRIKETPATLRASHN